MISLQHWICNLINLDPANLSDGIVCAWIKDRLRQEISESEFFCPRSIGFDPWRITLNQRVQGWSP